MNSTTNFVLFFCLYFFKVPTTAVGGLTLFLTNTTAAKYTHSHSEMAVEVSDPRPKRQKKARKEKQIAPNRCEHYLEHKKRQCAMQRKAGQRFCSEHMAYENTDGDLDTKQRRIPCPLDPKHSIWELDLEAHLKKCNAKPAEVHEAWYKKNFNTTYGDDVVAKTENSKTNDETFDKVVKIIEQFSETVEPLVEKQESHPGLDSWLEGKKNQKHILQQLSLIGSMRGKGLLSSSSFYVEFGCGKGELSRAVNACVIHDEKALSPFYGFGLIDRGSNRMKMDSKIIKDCEEMGLATMPKIKRTKIDIEHLDLDKFLESEKPEHVVGISKHLCGMATDLTLKLLLHSSVFDHGTFKGLLVAMCCRHVCLYSQLLPESRNYLAQHGIENELDFVALRRIVTWAVCGKREDNAGFDKGGILAERGEALGLVARRLIDESRVHAARMAMPGYKVELFRYTDKAVTLENNCICITKEV